MKRIMAGLAVAIGLMAGLGVSQGARADQTDPRLDELFAVLQTTENDARAFAAEQLIWSIWSLSADPASTALMRRGVQAMGQRKLDDALALFTQLVEKAPKFAEAWNKRATVNFLLGNLDQSITDIERTLALEPRHFGALSGLGQIEILLKDDAAALNAFQSALQVHPRLNGTQRIVDQLREKVQGKSL